MGKSLELSELWINRIIESLEGMEYGTVQIVIHDGIIVQLERTERKRFDNERAAASSPRRPEKSGE